MLSKLNITLVRLPSEQVTGIYKVGNRDDAMPDRMRLLAPDAATAYLALLAPVVVVSDMWRSPESSLRAVREKRGAQPPSFSAHNYGLAIDIDIAATRKRLADKLGEASMSKEQLDNWMKGCGWVCHRTDHKVAFEGWHYNYLPEFRETKLPRVTVTSSLIEKRILADYYSGDWRPDLPDNKGVQELLAELKLYHGEIDGIIGPRSAEAVRAFQRTWGLKETGKIDIRMLRTLAYVTATFTIVDASTGDLTVREGASS